MLLDASQFIKKKKKKLITPEGNLEHSEAYQEDFNK